MTGSSDTGVRAADRVGDTRGGVAAAGEVLPERLVLGITDLLRSAPAEPGQSYLFSVVVVPDPGGTGYLLASPRLAIYGSETIDATRVEPDDFVEVTKTSSPRLALLLARISTLVGMGGDHESYAVAAPLAGDATTAEALLATLGGEEVEGLALWAASDGSAEGSAPARLADRILADLPGGAALRRVLVDFADHPF